MKTSGIKSSLSKFLRNGPTSKAQAHSQCAIDKHILILNSDLYLATL